MSRSVVAKSAIVVFIVTAMLMLCSGQTSAQSSLPTLPHAFYGALKINGEPAPIGTEVEAKGAGVITGIESNPIVTTEVGHYGSREPLQPKLIVQGETGEGTVLSFYIDGLDTGQTYTWQSGEVTELDLEVNTKTLPEEQNFSWLSSWLVLGGAAAGILIVLSILFLLVKRRAS
jgi:hypothetical protein